MLRSHCPAQLFFAQGMWMPVFLCLPQSPCSSSWRGETGVDTVGNEAVPWSSDPGQEPTPGPQQEHGPSCQKYPSRKCKASGYTSQAADFLGSRAAALTSQFAKEQWKLIFNRILIIKCWSMIAHQETYCSFANIHTWMLRRHKPNSFEGNRPSPSVARTTQGCSRQRPA